MARKTAFDRYVAETLKDTGFAAAYETTRTQIETFDRIIRGLDVARRDAGLSQELLAQLAGLPAVTVLRLFTPGKLDPSLSTLLAVATALDLQLTLTRADRGKQGPRRMAKKRRP